MPQFLHAYLFKLEINFSKKMSLKKSEIIQSCFLNEIWLASKYEQKLFNIFFFIFMPQ